jgi:hypothetical protein
MPGLIHVIKILWPYVIIFCLPSGVYATYEFYKLIAAYDPTVTTLFSKFTQVLIIFDIKILACALFFLCCFRITLLFMTYRFWPYGSFDREVMRIKGDRIYKEYEQVTFKRKNSIISVIFCGPLYAVLGICVAVIVYVFLAFAINLLTWLVPVVIAGIKAKIES